MNRVWGSWPGAKDFDWWFEGSPHGRGLITLMEHGPTVVGMAAMSRFRALVGGTPQAVGVPLQVATDPEYRGRGIFQRLERENEQRAVDAGISSAVTFPNLASARVFTGALGWHELPGPRVWARVLRPLRAARAALGRGAERGAARRPEPGTSRGLDVRPIESLGPDCDELCARAARGYPNHIVRDAAHLDWRYLSAPRSYRCYGAYRGGLLEAIAVTGETTAGRLRAGFVADLVAPGTGSAAAAAVLARCLADLRPVADLVLAIPPAALRGVFLRAAFFPTPRRIRMLGKTLQPHEGHAPGSGTWHVALGDLDFF
jgi:GNAT superfamily N-acetyltransferase